MREGEIGRRNMIVLYVHITVSMSVASVRA